MRHWLVLVACASGIASEAFTTNPVCGQQNCINPVFPAVEELARNRNKKWKCAARKNAVANLDFCKPFVTYDFALPADEADPDTAARKQEGQAVTHYFFHVNALGMDAWLEKDGDGDCNLSIKRLVCWSFFPRCEEGKKDGEESIYLRPCASSCQNYISSCGVECCDESVQCVFEHKKSVNTTGGKPRTITTQGYEAQMGPNALCTGASGSRSIFAALVLPVLGTLLSNRAGAGAVLTSLAFALQGCSDTDSDLGAEVPVHRVGNWRAQKDYLVQEAVQPGPGATKNILNSCTMMDNAAATTCSAHGSCKAWNPANVKNPLYFCHCDRDWFGSECKYQRQSQAIAYTLSVLLGWAGADRFYLGQYLSGLLKLCTAGGFGLWWLADIVRVGSAPVRATDHNVAADLPHWLFMATTVLLTLAVSLVVVSLWASASIRARRRKNAEMVAAEEDRVIPYPAYEGPSDKLMRARYGSTSV
mmetsp:Transcript_18128/g.43562  ORF Transcript_18128/g.43562 Transcript_18128/m.43562 type:complete len:475 (+) Transcript_18128:57-1481(+)